MLSIHVLRPCHAHGAIFLATCNAILLLVYRCKIGKYTFPPQFANILLTYQTFVTNLHLLRVELRCKLPGKLHRVTGPLAHAVAHDQMSGWLRYCSRSVALVWRLGILVTGAGFVHMGNNNSVKRIAAALGGVRFFLVFILYDIITIQYNLIL